MTRNSTQNLLILHTYAETTGLEKETLAAAMESDSTIANELSDLIKTKNMLIRPVKGVNLDYYLRQNILYKFIKNW